MTMLPNEEQRLLKRSARAFLAERAPVAALRRLRDTRDPIGYDPAVWHEMAELGWTGMLVPEAHGGTAFGYKGLGLVLEECGRTLAASPLLATALLAAPLLVAAGNDAQQARWLPRIARGDCVATLAFDERPRHGLWVETRARAGGTGFVLDGAKGDVPDGHVADLVIVVARLHGAPDSPEGLACFLLDGTTRGLTRTRTLRVDSRNAARLTLDHVEVGTECLLGAPGAIWPVLEHTLDGGRAGLAAEMLGNAVEAFERTLQYLRLRTQFGVAIGSFQALKHRAALMYCELELTQSAVLEALTALDARRPDVAPLASLAKAKACDTLELVTNEAIQMHGGIGMTDAEEIGFFLKRARVAQQQFGDASFHRDRYATLMGF